MIKIHAAQLDKIQNDKLRDIAEDAQSKVSTEYIAFINDKESAILSLEHWANKPDALIYTLFVLDEYRKKGIGSMLLQFAEQKALELNCKKIVLEPRPFDRTITLNFLVDWYKKNGYQQSCSDTDKMFKKI